MQTCPECGSPYLPNTLFCESCGAALHSVHNGVPATGSGTEPGSGPLRAIALEIVESGRTVEVALTDTPIILGRRDPRRGTGPTIDLADDGALDLGVSRRHARFLLLSNQVLIEDLNSANGTRVNDVKLTANQPFPLQHGDLIRLGRLGMRIDLLTGS